VDQPTANATVQGSTTLAGWAVDQGDATGSDTGILDVVVYRDGEASAGGVLVGRTTKVARPDVDVVFALGGALAGWTLGADFGSVTAGSHTLYVYALTQCGWFTTTVPIVVLSPPAEIQLDSPASGQAVATGQQIVVAGWAADRAGPGTGVDAVHVYADGPAGAGGIMLGAANYGPARDDVAAAVGKTEWTTSGFEFRWTVSGLAPGPHTLYVYAPSTASGQWSYRTVDIGVAADNIAAPPAGPTPGRTTGESGTGTYGATCGPGYVYSSGRCVSPGGATGSCPAGYLYQNGTCISPGAGPSSCGPGYVYSSGRCIPTGSATGSCPPGYVYLNGTCVRVGSGGCGYVNPYANRVC